LFTFKSLFIFLKGVATILEDIFSGVLPESSSCEIKGLSSNLGIVFTAGEKDRARISWTLPELIRKDDTYVTLATFFGRRRQRKFIRHVLGFVIDFDTPSYMTVEAILDRYRDANLPLPDLIVSTKTPGHYQAFNLFPEPLRQDNDLKQSKINRIHRLMAERLGADTQAVGAERWVRRPTPDNIVYQDLDGRTSWDELKAWYEAYIPIKMPDRKFSKIIYIGHILGTPGGQQLQKPLAEIGQRNSWCYGLGLCLWDAGIPAEQIESKLFDWNSRLKEPLKDSEVSKIYKSVISGGAHHASSRIIEAITGLPSKVNGFYHLPKKRDRRSRDHLFEVREDIIADLLSCGVITESQKAWAARLGLSYRTLKLVIAQLRQEGILESTTGRGRYAQSSYNLSAAYLESIRPNVQAAAGSEGSDISGVLKGHSAISPLRVISAPHRRGVSLGCVVVAKPPSSSAGHGPDRGS